MARPPRQWQPCPHSFTTSSQSSAPATSQSSKPESLSSRRRSCLCGKRFRLVKWMRRPTLKGTSEGCGVADLSAGNWNCGGPRMTGSTGLGVYFTSKLGYADKCAKSGDGKKKNGESSRIVPPSTFQLLLLLPLPPPSFFFLLLSSFFLSFFLLLFFFFSSLLFSFLFFSFPKFLVVDQSCSPFAKRWTILVQV